MVPIVTPRSVLVVDGEKVSADVWVDALKNAEADLQATSLRNESYKTWELPNVCN